MMSADLTQVTVGDIAKNTFKQVSETMFPGNSINHWPKARPESTRCWGKYHCTVGLQFYKFGFICFTMHSNNNIGAPG